MGDAPSPPPPSSPSSSFPSRSLASAVGPSPAAAGERAAAAAVEVLAGAMQRQRRKRRSTESASSPLPSRLSDSTLPTSSSSSPGRQRPRRIPSPDGLRGGGGVSGVGGDPTGAAGADKKPGGGGWWPFGNRSSSSPPSSSSSSPSSSVWGSSSFFAPKNGNASQRNTANDGGPPPPEERILISEIVLQGIDDDPVVAAAARAAMTMRPNFAYTLTEVHEDVRRVFDTGFFTAATPAADDTRDGVRLTVSLRPYPRLRSVVVTGADSLPARVIQDAFAAQAGRTINYGDFRAGLDALSRWYDDRGIPAKVSVPADRADGSVDLHCAEPRVNSVSLVFVDRETGEPKAAPAPRGAAGAGGGGGAAAGAGGASDDDGERSAPDAQQPVAPPGGSGYTRPEVVLRQLRTSPGLPWSSLTARADIDAVYATGLFDGERFEVEVLSFPPFPPFFFRERRRSFHTTSLPLSSLSSLQKYLQPDVNVVPSPAEGSTEEDPRVDVTLSVVERKTGASLSFSFLF